MRKWGKSLSGGSIVYCVASTKARRRVVEQLLGWSNSQKASTCRLICYVEIAMQHKSALIYFSSLSFQQEGQVVVVLVQPLCIL